MTPITFLLSLAVLAADPGSADSISAATRAEVQLISGESVTGRLAAINRDAATIAVEGQTEQTIPLQEILALNLAAEDDAEAAQEEFSFELQLVDGSRLQGHGVAFQGRTFEFRGPAGNSLNLNKSHVRSIRFRGDGEAPAGGNDPHQEAWQKLLKEPILGDAIVLLREGELTYQEVVVSKIEGEQISIQLDDIQTDVSRDKLFGLLFYQRQERRLPSSLCRLESVDGSTFYLRDVELKEENLHFTTLAGVEHRLPLDRVESFDFASGNVLLLTELSPDRSQWSPYIGSLLSSDELAVVYAPRFNASFHNQPLTLELDGKLQSFSKGIAAQAKTELIYTLPEGFRQFRAIVGLPPRGTQNASLKFSLIGDQRILAEEVLTEERPTQEIVVDVSQARRLRIVVDFGETGGWGDILHICQPRILK